MVERVHPRCSPPAATFREWAAKHLGVELVPAEAAWLWERMPPLQAGETAPVVARRFQTFWGTCPKCNTILLLLFGADGRLMCIDCWLAEREAERAQPAEDEDG